MKKSAIQIEKSSTNGLISLKPLLNERGKTVFLHKSWHKISREPAAKTALQDNLPTIYRERPEFAEG